MIGRCLKWVVFILIFILIFQFTALAQTHQNRALLIGINTYRPTNDDLHRLQLSGTHQKDSRFFKGEVSWRNLRGPLNDVSRMEQVLTKRFGFTVEKLLDTAATRDGILAAIQKHIVDEPKPGDTVLFYFAGHGSLRLNSMSRKLDKFDETIVPSDAFTGVFDIRDKELARLFNRALDKQVNLIAVFDSCHSGTMARGPHHTVSRSIPYDDRDALDPEDYGATPAERGAVIITAALSTQDAVEIDTPLEEAHGVFTAAFGRALQNATYGWTALDLLESTDAFLKADDQPQQPSIEGPQHKRLFTSLMIQPRIRLAVKRVTGYSVELDGGVALGFGPSSELVEVVSPEAATLDRKQADSRITLIITQVNSLVSAIARVKVGDSSKVHVGDLFEIAKIVVPTEARIRIAIPAATADDAKQLEELATEIRGVKGITLVDDPSVLPPTHFIYLVRGTWVVRDRSGTTKSFGSKLTIKNLLTLGSPLASPKIFIGFPISEELLATFRQRAPVTNGAIEFVSSVEDAQYVLVGRQKGNIPSVALVRSEVFNGLEARSLVDNDGVICSTESPMPLRTSWIELRTGRETEIVDTLESNALLLGRMRAWLTLGSRRPDDVNDWPYRLSLKMKDSATEIGNNILKVGSDYDINLEANPESLAASTVKPRYVYVFGLQCDGKGGLLYPRPGMGAEAPLPLIVPGTPVKATYHLATQKVVSPLGRDTVFMLTSTDQLHNHDAFRFSGVSFPRGIEDPLGDLIIGLNGSSRGFEEIPSSWTIQVMGVRSSSY